jgi:hypothetical protein
MKYFTELSSLKPAYYNDNIFLKYRKGGQVGATPSRVQVIAVGCQRAFAARTAVTWFERHLKVLESVDVFLGGKKCPDS